MGLRTPIGRIAWHRTSLRTAAIGFVLLVCLIVIGDGVRAAFESYRSIVAQSRVDTENLTRSVAQHATDAIRTADGILIGLVEQIEFDGIGPDRIEHTRRLLQKDVAALPLLKGLAVLDAQGYALVHSLPAAEHVNFADRGYFQYHKTHTDRSAHIGTAVRSRALDDWIIPISRRINDRDGNFAGVVLATLDMNYFQNFYESFDIGLNGAILLASADGTLLVRRPFIEQNIGRSLRDGGIFRDQLSKTPVGSAEITSSTDGIVRLNSYRTLADYPLVVAVAVDKDEMLAGWRQDTWHNGVLTLIVVVIIAMLGLRLAGQIARRLRAERSAVAAAAEAERATLEKSAFLARMSHEIRTPMNGIIGFATLLLDGALEPAQQRRATRLLEAANSLLAILNDVLDMSKIEAGRLVLETIAFSPAEVTESALALVREEARAKNLALTLNVAADVPPFVSGDPTRLRQILLNLLTNALKFTESGGVMINVARDPANPDGSLRFEIADTGIGIPSERQHLLFRTFTQLDGSINRRYGGTGLGLAICKRLAEAMGGTVGVSSQLGAGSRFWFTIAAPPCAAPVRPAQPAVPQRGRTGHILVAEDVEINQIIMTEMLEAAGHRVEIAANGKAVIDALRRHVFDLVLMDVEMPDMDGLQATRAIRAMDCAMRDVPIIALTANVLPQQTETYRAAGMSDALPKPIDRNALLRTIAHWLGDGSDEAACAVIDESVPQELETFLGRDKLVELAGLFRDQLHTTLVELDRTNDPRANAASAHALVSAAGALGLAELSACCRAVITAFEAGAGDLAAQLAALREAAVRADAALEARYASRAGAEIH